MKFSGSIQFFGVKVGNLVPRKKKLCFSLNIVVNDLYIKIRIDGLINNNMSHKMSGLCIQPVM